LAHKKMGRCLFDMDKPPVVEMVPFFDFLCFPAPADDFLIFWRERT
jgi:hypothetical protein